MADKQNKQEQVRVLCWGACEFTGHPCTVYWQLDPATGEFGRTAQTGDVVDDFPPGSIEHERKAGHIEIVGDEGGK